MVENRAILTIQGRLSTARSYPVTMQYVDDLMKEIRQRWITETVVNYDKMRERELNFLASLTDEMQDSWQTSKKAKIRRRVGMIGNNPVDETVFHEFADGTEYEESGNPAYIKALLDISDRRRRILGFEICEKTEEINAAIKFLTIYGYTITPPQE